MADQSLLNQEIGRLKSNHKVHWLETGDHSYKILKRTRTASVNIYTEAAQSAREFLTVLN